MHAHSKLSNIFFLLLEIGTQCTYVDVGNFLHYASYINKQQLLVFYFKLENFTLDSELVWI
jgi:hypothetical protein